LEPETKPSLSPRKPSALLRLLHKLSSFLELTWTNLSSFFTNLRLRIIPQNDTKPADYKNDADKKNANTQRENIVHGVKGKPKEQQTQNDENASGNHRKQSFHVRFLRFLWRRRKWRRIWKAEHPGPNWAEITTVCVTVGILIVTGIQAGIYWKQARIMQESISQNERSIKLGMGQLGVAGRNAATAEKTLISSENHFILEERPYLVSETPDFVSLPIIADAGIQANMWIKNLGKTPAIKQITNTHFLRYPVTNQSDYIIFIESTFADLKRRNERGRKEVAALSKLSAGKDVAPGDHFFNTSQEQVSLSSTQIGLVKIDKIELFYVGVTSYLDVFGNMYETQFCYIFTGPNPKVWHICDSHNIIR
jgi:hypothetical protein